MKVTAARRTRSKSLLHSFGGSRWKIAGSQSGIKRSRNFRRDVRERCNFGATNDSVYKCHGLQMAMASPAEKRWPRNLDNNDLESLVIANELIQPIARVLQLLNNRFTATIISNIAIYVRVI